jgi:hypothetical protein
MDILVSVRTSITRSDDRTFVVSPCTASGCRGLERPFGFASELMPMRLGELND